MTRYFHRHGSTDKQSKKPGAAQLVLLASP